MSTAWLLGEKGVIRVVREDLQVLIDAGFVEVVTDAEGVMVEGPTAGKSEGAVLRVTDKGRRQVKGMP